MYNIQDMNIRKSDQIMSLPYINSEWSGEPIYEDATKIELACGNTARTVFVQKISHILQHDTFVAFACLDSKNRTITINTNYIISYENVTIVSRPYKLAGEHRIKETDIISNIYEQGTKFVTFAD